MKSVSMPFAHAALDIGGDAVADGEDLRVVAGAGQGGEAAAGEVVDRRMRLAEIEAVPPISS